jgi:cysteine synthase A
LSDIKKNILEAIGRTPLVELQRVRPTNGSRIIVKVEALSPGGSIKVRPAYNMIKTAEAEGKLKPGSIIVEATSGNQGIALSMVGAALGYRVKICMPINMSEERKMLMRSYGAELVLTDAGHDIGEAILNAKHAAEKLAAEDPRVFFASQFTNTANPQAHRDTTAVEILRDLGDTPVDGFVSGIGTGGTITGVGETLKAKYPNCKVFVSEPTEAAVIAGLPIGNHIQQGIGDGFIPDVCNTKIIDESILVTDDEAAATARRLAKEEGLFVGISSGTNVFAALKAAEKLGPGKTIVTICPDTGERYLSLGVFGREE